MKWTIAAGLACSLLATQVQAADVYKCKTADGRTIFSSSGCGTETGQVEVPDLKINEVGAIAGSDEVQRLRQERADAANSGSSVKVIRDSGKRDSKTFQGILNRRNDIVEDNLDRYRRPDTSGVTVIKDTNGETALQRARRLRTEAMEIEAQ
jgi:hypothetical protein